MQPVARVITATCDYFYDPRNYLTRPRRRIGGVIVDEQARPAICVRYTDACTL